MSAPSATSRREALQLWANDMVARLRSRGYIQRDLEDFKQSAALARREFDAPDTTADRFFKMLDDGPSFDAPERLKAPSLMTEESMLRYHHRADWQHTPPRLQMFAAKLVERFRKRGIPLYVHSAFRTKAEQDALVAAGHSKAKWPRAPHAIGEAVDIVHGRYHWEMTKQEWSLIGKIGKDLAESMQLGIEWGGDWPRFYDPAHWELKGWRDRVRHLEVGDKQVATPRSLLTKHRGAT